ncbi:MAG: glucosamine-6-phosphate isomerase [Bacteroidia bacterium]|nr:glucosamine-6-phosphate isomerase [Bacteroidia bacterium]NND11908.1 glucosamine-6-phosphate isomerase [Flavobacteriaceae bacterium]MBT8310180.1 glucosamine-6-phosphate isomerase [Bacteroidia bacterium]NNK28540.1 glucosamine-6-phosphate isomerase [Flavobacteriaceae bacterium]NNL60326.1 glucosamine-6-phosphate isomerase [Flavobacteriaceae bacterium]
MLNFMNTVKGSLLEGFYPTGWDFEKIDACCDLGIEKLTARASFWHPDFSPEPVNDLESMERRMGEEIAKVIIEAKQESRPLAIILPVGPMGMYKYVVNILKDANISADHVTTFNMDEWSDKDGNTMPGDQDGGFEKAMNQALFEPLGILTVPKAKRNFATKDNLPTYAEKIKNIKESGGSLVTVYGIGRACHIAFWEPQIGDEFSNDSDWKSESYRIGQALHPLTIEQNSLHSFASRFTLIPCWANTVGPGLFLNSDYCIGGADGIYPNRGACWQGMSLCVTLQYGPSRWIPSSWMPTLPGRLIFINELAGPLIPEAH